MKNGSTFGLILAGVAVVVGGAFAGYYFMGGSANSNKPDTNVVTTDVTSGTAPAPTPVVHRPMAPAGEYTAPGAPRIAISETKVAEVPKPQSATPPVDPESSQTGVAPPPAPDTTAPDSTMDANSDSTAAPANPAPADQSTTASPSQPSAQSATTPPSADSSDQPSASATQAPTPQPAVSADANTALLTTLYHVQAGAFQNEKNAKILEDALRHRGYTASTLHNSQDGQNMFVVQVGAYKNKVTADEVASDLQQNGFPASVSHNQ